jgi:DNA-binding response OmpR family regulator
LLPLLSGRWGAYYQHRLPTSKQAAKSARAPLKVRFGEFLLDPDSRQLFQGGAEVHLQPKAFELLDRVRLVFRSSPEAGSTMTEHHG